MLDSRDVDAGRDCGSPQSAEQPLTERAKRELERIRARLDRDLPPGPYITDLQFANILDLATKTLANRRSNPEDTLPRPFSPGGVRAKLHPREDIIDWLANEELRQLSVTVHRCR